MSALVATPLTSPLPSPLTPACVVAVPILWTPALIATRKARWAAAAARLAVTLAADAQFQAAVEAAVGFRLADLQRQLVAQSGPAAPDARAGERVELQMVTHGLLRDADPAPTA